MSAQDTMMLAARLGRDLPREYVVEHRDQEPLLTNRCPRFRHAIAWVWATPWGPWVECDAVQPTPKGQRDIAASLAAAEDPHAREVAVAAKTRGRYPDDSGLLRAGVATQPVAQLVAKIVAGLTPLERAEYESLRAPGHVPPARLRRVACRCGAWTLDDRELSRALDAGRVELVHTVQ